MKGLGRRQGASQTRDEAELLVSSDLGTGVGSGGQREGRGGGVALGTRLAFEVGEFPSFPCNMMRKGMCSGLGLTVPGDLGLSFPDTLDRNCFLSQDSPAARASLNPRWIPDVSSLSPNSHGHQDRRSLVVRWRWRP